MVDFQEIRLLAREYARSLSKPQPAQGLILPPFPATIGYDREFRTRTAPSPASARPMPALPGHARRAGAGHARGESRDADRPGARLEGARDPSSPSRGRRARRCSAGLPESDWTRTTFVAACTWRPYVAAFQASFRAAATAYRIATRSRTAPPWLESELTLLAPELVIPVGKLAIATFFKAEKLEHVVGQSHRVTRHGSVLDIVPLPHPSGASTWHRTEPGRKLLARALAIIARHPAWKRIVRERPAGR